MKKLLSLTVVLALASTLTASAADPTGSNRDHGDYLLQPWDTGNWSLSIGSERHRREIRDGFIKENYQLRSHKMSVGYNLQNWLTIFGTVGGAEIKPGDNADGDDSDTEIGYGMHARLFSKMIEDIVFVGDFLRVDATWYTRNIEGDDLEWEETAFGGTLTLVNELEGRNHYLTPSAISVYAGPYFSSVEGKGRFGDIEEEDDIMANIGITFHIGRGVSLNYDSLVTEQTSHELALRFRF